MKIFNFMIVAILACWHTVSISCDKDDASNEPIIIGESTPFTDYDGNTYKTIRIGDHIWMAENFKAVNTAAGQDVQGVYVYGENYTSASAYGRLYTWLAALQAAPTGWHLPTQEEWDDLIRVAGGTSVAGGKLKETGTTHWNAPNTGATNSFGFSAVGGGFRGPDGIYYELQKHGSYWGTANNAQDPYCIYIYYNYSNIITEMSPNDITSGIAFTVRYVKD